MNLEEKEQLLHKVVAGSAFLFALSLLPVAQYFIQRGYTPTTASGGQVAGASTETQTTVRGNMPSESRQDCLDRKEKDLTQLADWQRKTNKSLENAYELKVKPYKEALPVLTGTPEQIKSSREALNELIDTEKQAYLKKVADFEKAAESQKAAVDSRVCSE